MFHSNSSVQKLDSSALDGDLFTTEMQIIWQVLSCDELSGECIQEDHPAGR
jgi:hypothetical protein